MLANRLWQLLGWEVRQQHLPALAVEAEAEAAAVLSITIQPIEEAIIPRPLLLRLAAAVVTVQRPNKLFRRHSLLELLKRSVIGMSQAVGLAPSASEC